MSDQTELKPARVLPRRRTARGIALALALLACAPGLARAASQSSISVLLSRELWLAPESGMHGPIFIAYDRVGQSGDPHLHLSLNLETLRVAWDRISFCDGRCETGAAAKVELLFAGVQTDYYQRGRRLPERGFWANYVELEAYFKALMPNHHSVEIVLRGRRWFFWRGTDDGPLAMATDPSFVMPPDTWVFEPRFRYTYWNRADPGGDENAHRLFGRVRGFSWGVELGIDVRSDVRAWGALPADLRNDPAAQALLARQWLRAGLQLNPRWRTQLGQWFGWQRGADDLSRARIGGFSPYAVPLPGAPWGAFRSDRYFAVEWSNHFRLFGDIEVGTAVNVVTLNDPERTGQRDDFDLMAALSVFGDIRYHGFQIDVRLGWSPTMSWSSAAGAWSLFLGLGWGDKI